MFRTLSAVLLLCSVAISTALYAQDHESLQTEIGEAQILAVKQPLLALATAKELLNKVDAKTEPQLRLQVYALLNNVLSNMSRYPDALSYAEEGLKLAESLQFPPTMVDEVFDLKRGVATAYTFLGNEKGALEILDALEADAKSRQKNELLAGIYFQKGLLFGNNRRSVEALENLSHAWSLSDPNTNQDWGDIFHLIGNAFGTSGDTERSLKMHEAAIVELQERQLAQRLSLVAYAIGNIYMSREAYGDAVKWFTQARNWSHDVDDTIGEAFNSLQLATALIKKDDLANAGKALDACEKTFAQNGFIPQQILLELARADISLKQNKAQRALGSIIAAETRFSPRDLPPQIKRRLLQQKLAILQHLERHDQAADVALKLQELPPEESRGSAQLSETDQQRLQTVSKTIDQQLGTFQQQKTQQQKTVAAQQQQALWLQWGSIAAAVLLICGFFAWLFSRRKKH